jgi:hypothetical protein
VGFSATHFLCFVGLHFSNARKKWKCNEDPRLCFGLALVFGLFKYFIAMESPLIGGHFEWQHEKKIRRGEEKRLRFMIAPRKKALMKNFIDDLSSLIYKNWDMVLNFSSESIFIFIFNLDYDK